MKKSIMFALVAMVALPLAVFAASGSYTDGAVDGGAYAVGHVIKAGFGGGFSVGAGSSTWNGMTTLNSFGNIGGTTSGAHGMGNVDGAASSGGYADEGRGFTDSGTYSSTGTDAVAAGRGVFSSAGAGAGAGANASSMR